MRLVADGKKEKYPSAREYGQRLLIYHQLKMAKHPSPRLVGWLAGLTEEGLQEVRTRHEGLDSVVEVQQ